MPVVLRSTHNIGIGSIKTVVYGPPGVGKTMLCKTMPYPVVFSAEQGLLTLRRENIAYSEIKTMQDLIDHYKWAAFSNEPRTMFQSLCIDSISEVAEVILRNELGKTKDPRKAYGELISQMVGALKDFRDIPYYHILFIAKEEMQKEDSTGMLLRQPSFPGQKLAPAVPYLFDLVLHYEQGIDPTTRTRWRALRTAFSNEAVAKDRSGSLSEYELPDMSAIFQKIAKG